MNTEVAVYRGDSLLCIGTVGECAEKLELNPKTIRYYLTPTGKKRAAKRQQWEEALAVVRV